MPDIALKVLSRQLKDLESEGIIISGSAPSVEYSLSEKGESLREIMELMSDWSRKNILIEHGIN
jgi:DNA-binding HxlR family transcriptional regulator